MNTKKLKKVKLGFTLIELLVALFVFALISAFAFRAVNTLVKAGDQVGADQASLAGLQKALLIWERDMHQLVPGSAIESDGADGLFQGDGATTVATFEINAGHGGGAKSEGIQQVSYLLKNHVLSRVGVPPSLTESDTPPEGLMILDHITSATVEWIPAPNSDLGDVDDNGDRMDIAPMGVTLALAHDELGEVRRVTKLVSLPAAAIKSMRSLNTLGDDLLNVTTTGVPQPETTVPKKETPENAAPVVRTFSW